MDRWRGKVALVTGASSGIGAAIAAALVKNGLQVVGIARRLYRIEELSTSLKGESGKLHAMKCDIANEEEILSVFAQVQKQFGGVDILVNNAGVLYESLLGDGKTKDWRHMLDVNVLGLSVCTREALMNMKERNIEQGHIVHINSIAGHYFPDQPGFHMYSASKHAVTTLTEGLRKELVSQGSKIRITSVSPGLVDTEIFRVGVHENQADELYNRLPSLKPEDIADAVLYVLGTPPHVQVHELTIKPVGEVNL